MAHIDSTVPIADMILNKKFQCHIILPDFIERLEVQMEGKVHETFHMVFENIFKYVPNTRWDAEQIVSYIEWNLWKNDNYNFVIIFFDIIAQCANWRIFCPYDLMKRN